MPIYMQYDGIDGDVGSTADTADRVFVGTGGRGAPTAGAQSSGGGAGKASVQDLRSTPVVADPIVIGGFIDLDRDSAGEYYRVELKDVFVTSYQAGGHAG